MRIDLSISLVWLILHVRTIAAEDITASDIQNVTILIEQFARAHVHLQQVASSLKKDDSKLGGSEETGAKLATLIGEVEKEGAQHDKNEQEEAERRKRRLEEEERAREEQRQREIKEERERQAKLKEEKEEEERSRLEKAKAEEAKAKEEKQKGANKDEERKPTLEEEKSPQVAAIPRPGRETSKATKDKKDTYLREKLQIPPCKTSDLTASVEELDKEHLRLISPHQAGIKNPRNICYMNAALQGLFNSSEFRQALLLLPKAPEEYSDADAAVTSALQAVFARMALASLQEGGVISIEPDLLKLFAGLGLTIGAQDDVSVALDALLNRMPTHLKQIYLMGGGEAAPYTSKSRLAVQYYENCTRNVHSYQYL